MAMHAALALPMAYFINIWADEASTMYTTKNGLLYALERTLPDEKQAPLYFWLMSVWRYADHSLFFARSFSIICSLAAIWFFFVLAKRFWSGKVSLALTAFFALHPFLFWASNEARGYAMAILLTVLLLSFFRAAYWNEDQTSSKRDRLIYGVIAVVALYSNYYLGFFLVGGFAALLGLRRFRDAENYFLDMIVAGVFFLPMLFVIKQQFDVRTSDYVPETYLIEGLKALWNHVLTFALPTEIYSSPEQPFISVIRVWIARILLVLLAVFLAAKRKLLDEKLLGFGLITGVILLFFIGLYIKTGTLHIQIRHAAVFFVPLILTIFSAVWAVRPKEGKSRVIYFSSIAILLAVFYAYAIPNIHPNFTKRGDWARIAEFIEQNESEDQPLMVFVNYETIALDFYYDGKNKFYPGDKIFDWNLEAKPGSPDTYRKQIEYMIASLPADHNEFWLITQEDCQTSENCQPLENFVKTNYTVVLEKDFYLERVRLLRKK